MASKAGRLARMHRGIMKSFLRKQGKDPGDLGVKNSDLRRLVAERLGVSLPVTKNEAMEFLLPLMRGKPYNWRDGVVTARELQHKKFPPTKISETSSPKFYGTDEWRLLRYQVLKRFGGRCQCCGRGAADDVTLHVDHIKPRSKYPELELDINNLQVLCEDCNLGKLAWDETDWRPYSHSDPPGKTGVGGIVTEGHRKLN